MDKRRRDVTTVVRRIWDFEFTQVIAIVALLLVLGFIDGFSLEWLGVFAFGLVVAGFFYLWRKVLRSAEPDERRKDDS